MVFDKKVNHAAGGPTQMKNAKIIVIQFQISPPKTDIKQGSELFVIYYHFESVIY